MAARVSVMPFFLFPRGNVNFIRSVKDLAISLPILNADSESSALRHAWSFAVYMQKETNF